ncbi:DUF1800 domain-containing protein [Reichenbachiella ulvae]|uniref:DUF1800 domain-containing protein n=1 Tax=Reichenbachiella ulvae TaxID=2980104 RepID=A0ABT3CT44_9BACT|nr:DUF1800 domain-containing protein [Reichenbachiella ulvae]MCV9386807.1 DUF1800 domain-containing protein [Reichenbachiella ulvae]
MPFTPISGTLGKNRAAHLLRRACTGATPAQIDEFAALTAAEAFARLNIDNLPKPLPPVDPATGTEWISGPIVEDVNSDNLGSLLKAWIVGQMLGTDAAPDQVLAHSFRERIVFFMHTLFTTKESKVRDTKSLYYQWALFRHFAFDRNDIEVPTPNPDPDSTEILPPTIYPVNFKHLTKKVCVENAMLQFLDGRLNVKGSPNENFGRELLELYTIGRGLEGNLPEAEFQGDYIFYTEQDVQEAAKVLSGFDLDVDRDALGFNNIDEETELPRGVIKGGNIATQHDTSVKTFSSRLGGATIEADPNLLTNGTSPNEESVLDEISQLVDMIYEQAETPAHICRRLYRFFVYHEVDETIQSGIIQDMADIFIANEYKLTPVLEALFTSEEFYRGAAGVNDDTLGAIIKSPLDLTVGFMKNFGVQVPSAQTEVANFYELTLGILGAMNGQGMDLYEPFEVAGYSAYHQFPLYNRSWITTNYLTNRYNYIRTHLSTEATLAIGEVNPYDWVKANISDAVASDARQLIISLAEYLLPMSSDLSFDGTGTSELTQERMNYFLSAFLMNPQIDTDPELAWTERWNGNLDMETVNNQLANLLNAMLQTPEYQLM